MLPLECECRPGIDSIFFCMDISRFDCLHFFEYYDKAFVHPHTSLCIDMGSHSSYRVMGTLTIKQYVKAPLIKILPVISSHACDVHNHSAGAVL